MDSLLSGTGCRTRNRALGRAAQCIAAALLCVLLLCACDPYDGYRPYDYGEAKWVCEEYDAWFLIDENLKMKFCGEIIVGGEKKNIAVRFLKADFVAIVPYEMVDGEVKLAYEDYLWHGDAKFSPTELVLHSPMVNYLFD